jgi:hypothetical protein
VTRPTENEHGFEAHGRGTAGIGRSRSALVLAATLFAGASCGGPKDPVETLLGRLVEAAEARDVAAFLEGLDPAFQGPAGMGRAEAGAELRRLFAAYESVEVLVSEAEREAAEAGTRVRTRVDFSGKPKDLPGFAGLLPDAAAYRFELVLREQQGRLAVAAASWERLDFTAPEANSPRP